MLSDLVGGSKAVIMDMLPKDVKHLFKLGKVDFLIASVDSFEEDLEPFKKDLSDDGWSELISDE
jgi:hypothetical protein